MFHSTRGRETNPYGTFEKKKSLWRSYIVSKTGRLKSFHYLRTWILERKSSSDSRIWLFTKKKIIHYDYEETKSKSESLSMTIQISVRYVISDRLNRRVTVQFLRKRCNQRSEMQRKATNTVLLHECQLSERSRSILKVQFFFPL